MDQNAVNQNQPPETIASVQAAAATTSQAEGVPTTTASVPMENGDQAPNAKDSKKSLYLILTIIGLVVLFAILSFFLFTQKNTVPVSRTNLPTQTMQITKPPTTPTPTQATDTESKLNSLNLGNPDTDLQGIQQNVNQL